MNTLVERLNRINEEIERLKVVKQKAASLLHTREYPVEVQITLTRVPIPGFMSSYVKVKTVTTGGENALVSIYFDGSEDEERMHSFQRYAPYDAEPGEMDFVVSCAMPSEADLDEMTEKGSITITVPLRIVATSEVAITVEEFDG